MDITKDILTLISASSMTDARKEAMGRLEQAAADGELAATLYLGYHAAMRELDYEKYVAQLEGVDLQAKGKENGVIAYLIGLAHGGGFYLEESVSGMVDWLKKSSELGCALGDFELGYYHFHMAAEGEESASQQELNRAIECFKKASAKGLVEGDLALGELYMDLEEDRQAEPFFKRAADAGNSDGTLGLGLIALGSERIKEAKKLLNKAMDQGNAAAAFHLGSIFMGIDNDQKKGVEYFEKSAEAGYLDASFELGLLNYEGEMLTQDYGKALEYFKVAAAEDHPDAQFYLGTMYLEGLGVEKDQDEAKIWLQKAAESGDEDAAEILNML